MVSAIGLPWGSAAPRVSIRTARGAVTLAGLGQQIVLAAFIDEPLSNETPEPRVLADLRAELRGLGAVLFVVGPRGIYLFRADDDVEHFARDGEVDAADIAAARCAFGLGCAKKSAVFLLDEERAVRFVHSWEKEDGSDLAAIGEALACAGRSLVGVSSSVKISRRDLVLTTLAAALALTLGDGCKPPGRRSTAPSTAPPVDTSSELEVTLDVNGELRKLHVDVRTSLLDALRERLGLTGTKKGCDHGQCGACTVLVDGRRVTSCLLLAVSVEGSKVVTIEGLSREDTLHPMQSAFITEDALQCGYCTPGQIMSAVGLLSEGHARTDQEVREAMSGNICRCGAYTNIVAAIQKARTA